MDAFYASIEQRDHPEYRGKPLAVGRAVSRGVVAAASYEARAFGVRSAMPAVTASRLCPDLIFVEPRFEVYKAVSAQIHQIFHTYTDLVEPLSLDEAYLDVSSNKMEMRSATLIAKEIKKRILKETDLVASAGVSFNKFLAKVASDFDKPDGLYVVTPQQATAFVEQLPIERFFGVGKVTAQKMHALGIRTGANLKAFEAGRLVQVFGKAGHYFYQVARAIDLRPVRAHRESKSIGAERTFENDKKSFREIMEKLEEMVPLVINRSLKGRKLPHTVTVKIKFSDFKQITRSKTLSQPVLSEKALQRVAAELLGQVDLGYGTVRLAGITLSGFHQLGANEGVQLTLDF